MTAHPAQSGRRRPPAGWSVSAAASLVTVAALGCWSAPLSQEIESVDSEPPPSPSPDEPEGPAAPPAEHAEIQFGTEQEPEAASATPPLAVRLLPGGMIGIARIAATGHAVPATAFVRLAMRTEARDTPGTALLAAHALAELPGVDAGLPSLAARIRALGGEILVHAQARATMFDLMLPSSQWRAGLTELRRSLQSPPTATIALDRVRARIAADLRRANRRHDAAALADVVLRSTNADGRGLIHEIEDVAAAQVFDYQRRTFNAGGAVLALWLPEGEAGDALGQAGTLLEPWAAASGAVAPLAPRPPAAAYWTESDAARAGVLLRLPQVIEPLAAARFALHACITLDGVGGRLAASLARAGVERLGLHSEILSDGVDDFLLLHTDAAVPADVLWRAYRDSWASLVSQPPRGIELQTAARRAILRLQHDEASPRSWADRVVAPALVGAPPPDLARVLAALQDPSALDIDAAVKQPSTASLLCIGPQPPAVEAVEPLGVTPLPSAFVDATTPIVPEDIAAQIEAATPILEATVRESGGSAIRVLEGWSATAQRVSDAGASAADRIWFRQPDRLRISRRVLNTVIETVLGPDGRRVERVGAQRVTLSADEALHYLREVERHPLWLLAQYARGEDRYRLVSIRRIQDRQAAVLERVPNGGPTLRMTIDLESALIRTIETSVYRPDVKTEVPILEHFSDYRDMRGVRAPFYRTTHVDGVNAVVHTKWSDWVPGAPEDGDLRFSTRGDD